MFVSPSMQLLDCFGIPVLMALSWFILYARYRVIHFIAVAVCLLGVGTMVGADILAGREDNSGKTCVTCFWFSHRKSFVYVFTFILQRYSKRQKTVPDLRFLFLDLLALVL